MWKLWKIFSLSLSDNLKSGEVSTSLYLVNFCFEGLFHMFDQPKPSLGLVHFGGKPFCTASFVLNIHNQVNWWYPQRPPFQPPLVSRPLFPHACGSTPGQGRSFCVPWYALAFTVVNIRLDQKAVIVLITFILGGILEMASWPTNSHFLVLLFSKALFTHCTAFFWSCARKRHWPPHQHNFQKDPMKSQQGRGPKTAEIHLILQ